MIVWYIELVVCPSVRRNVRIAEHCCYGPLGQSWSSVPSLCCRHSRLWTLALFLLRALKL